MQKIPTIYTRDTDGFVFSGDLSLNPQCLWVFAGYGTPLRKYDGVCCLLNEEGWWTRRSVNMNKPLPPNFRSVYTNWDGKKAFGWVPAEESSFYPYLEDALTAEHPHSLMPFGTYELLGPKINGNRENCTFHYLQYHNAAERVQLPDKWWEKENPFEILRRFFLEELGPKDIEGVVWRMADGRLAKLKVRDFRPLEVS